MGRSSTIEFSSNAEPEPRRISAGIDGAGEMSAAGQNHRQRIAGGRLVA